MDFWADSLWRHEPLLYVWARRGGVGRWDHRRGGTGPDVREGRMGTAVGVGECIEVDVSRW